jgi:hypothetical protein
MEPTAEGAGGDFFSQILDSKKAKQLTMVYVRNIEKERIIDGYRESFKKILGSEEAGKMQDKINSFLAFFDQNIKSNDQNVLRWLPDGTVEVYYNGQMKGKVKDEQFGRSLWSIWFGKNSVVNRNQLVSLLK